MSFLKALVCVLWVFYLSIISGFVHANPVVDYKLVGKGQMTWFWFDIYNAKLSTPSGGYQEKKWPLALELIYLRDISRDDLIQTTEDEWQRQRLTYQVQWLRSLEVIWTDIRKNDSILLFVDSDAVSHFYYNGKLVGRINDPDFASAFTAIWLSNNTLKPKLRKQLIGAS
jgi:hypothetical protein